MGPDVPRQTAGPHPQSSSHRRPAAGPRKSFLRFLSTCSCHWSRDQNLRTTGLQPCQRMNKNTTVWHRVGFSPRIPQPQPPTAAPTQALHWDVCLLPLARQREAGHLDGEADPVLSLRPIYTHFQGLLQQGNTNWGLQIAENYSLSSGGQRSQIRVSAGWFFEPRGRGLPCFFPLLVLTRSSSAHRWTVPLCVHMAFL